MIRPLALAAATLALGACTAQERAGAPPFASLDAAARSGTVPLRATPVVVLPAWIGQPVSVRERNGAGGFEQAITLAAPGPRRGRDDLVLVSSLKEGALDAVLGGKPTEDGIRAELASAVPGTARQVVTRPSANAYGPCGLAIGRNGATRCLYAWQWIPEALVLAGGAAAPLSPRLRLCREDATFEAMAAAVTQLRLVPRFSGEPVAARLASRPARPRQNSVRHPRPVPPAAAPDPEPAPPGMRDLGEAGPPGGPMRSILARAIDAPSQPAAGLPPDAAILPPQATRGPGPVTEFLPDTPQRSPR